MSSIKIDITWRIENGILSKYHNNEYITPSADSIFEMIFENKYSDIFSVNDKLYLESILNFSKYPADLYVILETNAEYSNQIELNIYASVLNNSKYKISNISETKHIVLENTWYPLLSETVNEIEILLSKNKITRSGIISLGTYLALIKSNSEYLINDVSSISNRFNEFNQQPYNLKATLYPYQKTGWQWLKYLTNENLGGILADEMGLGKTIQIISLFCSENNHKLFPSLIVAPSTLLENWKREVIKFAPDLKPYIHQGPNRTGFPSELKKFDLIITSYETIVRDLSLMKQIQWRIIVLDEAQAVKNPLAKRTISVKSLSRNLGIAVTGTPIENRLLDLWSILDFSVPGFLGTKEDFEMRYSQDLTSSKALETIVSPLLLRRKVSDVAKDLPARIIIPQILEMSNEEAETYENIRQDIINQFKTNSSLAVLSRLRMYTTHPFLINSSFDEFPENYSTKYMRLLEIIEEVVSNNNKLILFTSYNKMNDIIKIDIQRKFGIYVNSIDGRTEIGNRQNIVDDFSKIAGSALLVLNPVAAGTGLNITAANHVIHYNLEWNPAKEDQASARAYRRGQTLPVTIHRLYYMNTVEEVINERLTRKRELANNTIVGVTGDNIDADDILKSIQRSPKFHQ